MDTYPIERKEKARNTHDFVYPQLREYAVNYRFPLGGQIQVSDLAKALGVSITPVREALQRLAAEGLIESKEMRGFFGKALAMDTMTAQYEVGLLLLSEALKVTRCSDALLIGASITDKRSLSGSNRHERGDPDYRTLCLEETYIQIGKLSGKRVLLDAIRQFVSHTHYIRRIGMEAESWGGLQLDRVRQIKVFLTEGKTWSAQELLYEQFEAKLLALPSLVKEGIFRSYSRAVTNL